MSVELFTLEDAQSHLLDWLGSNVRQDAVRDCKRAIQQAYRELPNEHHWSYFYSILRLNLVAPYSTGTIEYIHSGGSSERLVNLTGGSFPEWAAEGTLRLSNAASATTAVDFEVARLISATQLQLEIASNPGVSIAAGTTYTLFRDTYTLPCDFVAMDRPYSEVLFAGMDYIHPQEWLGYRRHLGSVNTPRVFTIRGDPNVFGGLAVSLFPYPDIAQTLDAVYLRRPRALKVVSYDTGRVSVAAGSTNVAGTGTVFTNDMVGAVIRLSGDSLTGPTGFAGNNPFSQERTIMSVSNAITLAVDAPFDTSLGGVKYIISDPVDFEQGAMMQAFLRLCEKYLSIGRLMKDRPNAFQAYEEALRAAKGTDRRSLATRVAGTYGYAGRLSLNNYPKGPDIP